MSGDDAVGTLLKLTSAGLTPTKAFSYYLVVVEGVDPRTIARMRGKTVRAITQSVERAREELPDEWVVEYEPDPAAAAEEEEPA